MSEQKSLYERAVELTKQRASISTTNLKTALNCTDAQAKSFLRIMKEEGVIGSPSGNLGRFPVLMFERERYAEEKAVINLDQPELSVVHGQDIPVDEILDAEGQDFLRRVMDELIELEARQAAIGDERRVIMEMSRLRGLAPKILKKVAAGLFRDKKRELLAGAALTQLYLHALGEIIDDFPDAGPTQTGGGNGTRH